MYMEPSVSKLRCNVVDGTPPYITRGARNRTLHLGFMQCKLNHWGEDPYWWTVQLHRLYYGSWPWAKLSNFVTTQEKSTKSCKSQTPPYLPNGDSVGKCFHIIGFITPENGGVGHLQIPKKNRNGVTMPIEHKNPKFLISCKLDTFKQKQLHH